MPLAHSGPKAFSFPPGSAKVISPACAAGKGPFVRLPAKHPSMFHVELFLSSVLPLACSRPKAFFFSFGSDKAINPACAAGRGPFVQFLQSTLQCSTWNFFHRLCLWPSAGRRLFLRLGQSNQPGPSGGEVIFCPIIPPKPIQMFHMEHFSPFKMPKSRVLCALLVSIPLQVCYNNRRSPFSG